MLKLNERIACDGVLRAGEAELDRARAARNQDVTALESASLHGNSIWSGEAGHAMKSMDALLGEALLAPRRHGIGKRPLEGDQLFPVDAQRSRDAVLMHPPRKVDRLRAAHQHFLG